jgi:hypothetical protein
MPAPAVRIRGLRETQRAFRRMSGGLDATLKAALYRAAEPVAREAKSLAEQWDGVRTSTIGPRVVASGTYVTQRARKVTGDHPNIGALQMTDALIPALEHNQEAIYGAAEGALDTIENMGGF